VVFTLVAAAFLLLLIALSRLDLPSAYELAFYSAEESERIEGVLRFAREHRGGRYLVEVPPPREAEPAAWYDSPALSAYLGAQGNEALSVVFREASPNAVFFNPQAHALSIYKDSFGISSVLADDLDFNHQSLAQHLERARWIGTKYLVVVSPELKDQLARESAVGARYDCGAWSVFELKADPPPRVRPLAFRPALLVSAFSLKERRRDESSFVRWAEEQFTGGWFDTLLVRSPEARLDRLAELDQFGALIIDTYQCGDEGQAIERLRRFAEQRPLVLLESETPLFHRLRAAVANLPLAEVIERQPQAPGPWLAGSDPSFDYRASAIRQEWGAIRATLERYKVAVPAATRPLDGKIDQTAIQITPASPPEAESLPVLITTTYFPNWQREDGSAVYAATPFFMLTFIRQPVRLNYQRRWFEQVALWTSAGALLLLGVASAWPYRRRLARASRLNQNKPDWDRGINHGEHGEGQ
jgi:hypothetical protein